MSVAKSIKKGRFMRLKSSISTLKHPKVESPPLDLFPSIRHNPLIQGSILWWTVEIYSFRSTYPWPLHCFSYRFLWFLEHISLTFKEGAWTCCFQSNVNLWTKKIQQAELQHFGNLGECIWVLFTTTLATAFNSRLALISSILYSWIALKKRRWLVSGMWFL